MSSPYLKTEIQGAKMIWLPIKVVRPPHFVLKIECLKISESMEDNGWVGRPLIAYRVGKKYQAITGSHRIKAARIAGLVKIPVFVMDDEILFDLKKAGLGRDYCDFFYTLTKQNEVPSFRPLAKLFNHDLHTTRRYIS